MKRTTQKGFTLIELIIAIFTSTIVVLAAGSILFFGQTYWNNNWKRVNLQRDASYAMHRISRPIKAGTLAKLEGSGIRIYTEDGWNRFFLVPNSSILKLESLVGEKTSEIILADNIKDLQFIIDGNKVTISILLAKDNLETSLLSTVMMRNYYGG